MTHDSGQAGALTKLEITPQMVEAGEKWLTSEYRESPRLLADASPTDIVGLLRACLGVRAVIDEDVNILS